MCASAGDPQCPCGTWKDFDENGVWSSYSYHCAGQGPGLIGGGWENMDSGDGYVVSFHPWLRSIWKYLFT